MASTGQMSKIDPASGGRIARIPGAATALACFFRRNKTAGERKGRRSGRERSLNGKARLAEFLQGGRTVSSAKGDASRASKAPLSEYRCSSAAGVPPGHFVSPITECSATLVEQTATEALDHKGTGHPTTESRKRQPLALLAPLRPPDEKSRLWSFLDPTFLVPTMVANGGGGFTVGEVPFLDLSLLRPQRTCKTGTFCDKGKGETDATHGQAMRKDAETSASAAPFAYLHNTQESEKRDSGTGTPASVAPSTYPHKSQESEKNQGSTGFHEFESLLHDPCPRLAGEQQHIDQHKPHQTSEQHHIKEVGAGPRRAAAAGRLSSKEERPSQEKRRICLNGERSNDLFAQLGVAISCRKGLKRVPSNQDDFFAYSCDNWGMYGVFDGHGRGGHVVANFVQWHLPNLIHAFMNRTDNLKAALRFAFNKVDSLLKEASAAQWFDSASSGSTASVVLHKRQEKKLYVAYVGDSTVVLARRNNQGQLVVHAVTRDHRPDDPTERSRIESLGGEIRRPVGHVPYRVFVKGKDYPGLAMSRSLGDFMGHCAGVTMEPDILELELIEGVDELVVMCTDGVWEFISPHEAVEIVGRYSFRQAAEAVRALSCEAWKRWLKEDGHSVDDITVQLIHLFPPMTRDDRAQSSKPGHSGKISVAF